MSSHTAHLAAKGEPDENGFAGDPDTRRLTIRTSDGETVFTAQSADTLKAADNHIGHAGFQRDGDWRDGVAAVIPIPQDVIRKRRLKTLGILAIIGLVIVGVVAWFSSLGTKESDAIDACNERLLGVIELGSVDDISNTSAHEFEESSNPNYANEWSASGVITSEYMTGIPHEIPFHCTLYMDNSGNEIDSTVSIDF